MRVRLAICNLSISILLTAFTHTALSAPDAPPPLIEAQTVVNTYLSLLDRMDIDGLASICSPPLQADIAFRRAIVELADSYPEPDAEEEESEGAFWEGSIDRLADELLSEQDSGTRHVYRTKLGSPSLSNDNGFYLPVTAYEMDADQIVDFRHLGLVDSNSKWLIASDTGWISITHRPEGKLTAGAVIPVESLNTAIVQDISVLTCSVETYSSLVCVYIELANISDKDVLISPKLESYLEYSEGGENQTSLIYPSFLASGSFSGIIGKGQLQRGILIFESVDPEAISEGYYSLYLPGGVGQGYKYHLGKKIQPASTETSDDTGTEKSE